MLKPLKLIYDYEQQCIKPGQDEIYNQLTDARKIKNVTIISDNIKNIMNSMMNFCKIRSGVVAMAAPQFGINKKIIVIDYKNERRCLINPIIFYSSGRERFLENCVSIYNPNKSICGFVERPSYIEMSALDYNGKEIEIKASGEKAVILQHEIDHLNGILFLEKIVDKMHGFSNAKEFHEFCMQNNKYTLLEEPKIIIK